MRIAIVEDNLSIAKGIAYRLQDRGHATDLLHDGEQADEFLRGDDNDLIILDINLPGQDGLSILQGLRGRGDMRPVLLLTARGDTTDRVEGLNLGADDYLVKPFEMDELEARIRALGRRGNQAIKPAIVLGRLSYEPDARALAVDGAPLELPRRELACLDALLSAGGRVVSKQHLLESVYGTGADVDEAAIEVHLSRLRKKLARFGIEIKVRRGLGYGIAEVAS